MLKNKGAFLLSISFVLILGGCKSNPLSKLVDPSEDTFVPGTTGVYTIYQDELFTGGEGIQLIPGGENQALDFSDRSDPRRSRNQFKYQWNGGDVLDNTTQLFQHLFAGVQLTYAPAAILGTSSGLNLTTFGYTQLTFFARGTLSQDTVIQISGPDDGSGGITPAPLILNSTTLSSNWQKYSIAIPGSDFADVRIFFTGTFQYTQPPRTTNTGNGGIVYFDEIRYTR